MSDLPLVDSSFLDAHRLRGKLSQAIGQEGKQPSDLRIPIYEESRFVSGAILATDGAWKGGQEGFNSILLHSLSARDAVERVLLFSDWTGGVDNASIIAIDEIEALCEKSSGQSLLTGAARVTLWACGEKILLREVPLTTQHTSGKHSMEEGETKPSAPPRKINIPERRRRRSKDIAKEKRERGDVTIEDVES